MLPKQAVKVGKCYVNKRGKVAREVLEADEDIVKFYTHHLDTGNSCGSPSECMRQDFLRWADREATSAELARLRYQELNDPFRATRWQVPETLQLQYSMANETS